MVDFIQIYPLYTWSYKKLCQRLDLLLAHEFFNEAVVASTQTLEQAIKRVIKQRMTICRQGFKWAKSSSKKNLRIVPINSTSERDASVHMLHSLALIEEAWRKLVASRSRKLRLGNVVNSVAGPRTWTIISNKGKVKVPIDKDIVECRYGLFELRHLLVHGTHSPPFKNIKTLAHWGVETTKTLLDPSKGFAREIGWDPLKRISPFRKSVK